MRAFSHAETEIPENLHHLFPHLAYRMDGAHRFRAGGKGDIDFFRGKAGIEGGISKLILARCDGSRNLVLDGIEHGTGFAAGFRIHGAKALHGLGDTALLAKLGHTQRLKGSLVGRSGKGRHDLLFQLCRVHAGGL